MKTDKRKLARRPVRLWFRWDDDWRPGWVETAPMREDDCRVLLARLEASGFLVSMTKPNNKPHRCDDQREEHTSGGIGSP